MSTNYRIAIIFLTWSEKKANTASVTGDYFNIHHESVNKFRIRCFFRILNRNMF
jgi:hypothetical protein